MVRNYPKPEFSKEQHAQRRYAAVVAMEAVRRLQTEGLVTTAEFRTAGRGLTLDRALVENPYEIRSTGDYHFPAWLQTNDPTFDPAAHTLGYWADQQARDDVIATLRRYARDMDPKMPVGV